MELQEVLEKILKVEEELEGLNGALLDWADTYQGESFNEQTELATCLENRVQAVTHEAATEIGFARKHIKQLVLFIEFRKKWSQFSDKELSEILDSYMVSFAIKKQLRETIDGNVSEMIEEIRCEWNKLFHNICYSNFKEKFII